jgi:hypothetical protein
MNGCGRKGSWKTHSEFSISSFYRIVRQIIYHCYLYYVHVLHTQTYCHCKWFRIVTILNFSSARATLVINFKFPLIELLICHRWQVVWSVLKKENWAISVYYIFYIENRHYLMWKKMYKIFFLLLLLLILSLSMAFI